MLPTPLSVTRPPPSTTGTSTSTGFTRSSEDGHTGTPGSTQRLMQSPGGFDDDNFYTPASGPSSPRYRDSYDSYASRTPPVGRDSRNSYQTQPLASSRYDEERLRDHAAPPTRYDEPIDSSRYDDRRYDDRRRDSPRRDSRQDDRAPRGDDRRPRGSSDRDDSGRVMSPTSSSSHHTSGNRTRGVSLSDNGPVAPDSSEPVRRVARSSKQRPPSQTGPARPARSASPSASTALAHSTTQSSSGHTSATHRASSQFSLPPGAAPPQPYLPPGAAPPRTYQ